MSKILVVQPYRMLQHAIGLSLMPQHQFRVTGSIPDVNEARDVEAAIIDAAALRETDGLSTRAIRSIQSWNIPIVWIDNVNSTVRPPNNGRLVRVNTPIAKQSLQDALAECLEEFTRGPGEGLPQTGRAANSSRAAVTRDGIKREIIDLVEVVEEAENENHSEQEQL
jgi:hypothetical protein